MNIIPPLYVDSHVVSYAIDIDALDDTLKELRKEGFTVVEN